MNYRFILKTLGYILLIESVFLLFPLGVALFYHENVFPYLATILLIVMTGGLLTLIKDHKKPYYAKEGLLITTLAWILLSIFGALPFVFSKSIPSFVDALFETISGFTTTGSSIVESVEQLPNGILFWRSFTHWIGGMGILVFALAVLPIAKENSMHVMKAEAPGPFVSKLSPKIGNTAKWLYGIYLFLTVLEIALLWIAGMPLFDSIVTAFATAGTGGFGIKNTSIAFYHSAYIDYVVSIFMLLFGINFNVFFLLIMRKFKQAFSNEEMRTYLLIILVSVILITINISSLCESMEEAFRLSFFQVSSIITTTGYSTTDFNLWPTFSKFILFLLMLFGACGGSTGGGIKISRIIILFKKMIGNLVSFVHPGTVKTIKFEGKKVEEKVVDHVGYYFVLYFFLIGILTLLISLDNFDFETTLTSVISCVSNIGPGLGLVGPMGNFAMFSDFSKIVLSLAMLLGRLELYPVLLFLSPRLYIKK